MSASPPDALDSIVEPDPDLAQVARSAAHAAECAIAGFYATTPTGAIEVAGCTQPDHAALDAAVAQVLEEVSWDEDAFLIVNDVGAGTEAGAAVRFLAFFRVPASEHVAGGLLVVADAAPRAGLSAATLYVLRTHAVHVSALLALRARRSGGQAGTLARPADTAGHLRLLDSVVVDADDAVLVTEAEPINPPGPRIISCNAAFTRVTGFAEAEIIGRTPRLLQSADTNRATLDRLRAALTDGLPVEVELLNTRKDGTPFWVELSVVPLADAAGVFTHWVSVRRDVSGRKAGEGMAWRTRLAEAEKAALRSEIAERKRSEARLLHAAFHDELTHLRNRAFLADRLAIVLARLPGQPEFRCAILLLNLDGFKLVNDSLGHRAGDRLLMEVAGRLRRCLRPQDTLARLGGDEFAVLIEGVEGAELLANLAARIIKVLREPVWLGRQEVFSSGSVGIVTVTAEHGSADDVLRDADIAMAEAKRQGAGGVATFAPTMHESLVAALSLRTDLRNALARGEFRLLYQPICAAASGEIIGVEALVRWHHPTRGTVMPGAFIPTAEEIGLIREIGRWVLAEASRQLARWRDRFAGLQLRLGVNASAEELKQPGFAGEVHRTLQAAGIEPGALQLEVTEGIFLQDPEAIGQVLAELRASGVRIALDDFGTGYSSLSYLDRYQMDTIKIDQSFVSRMLTEPRTLAIVGTIIALGRVLSLDIVAEGVENPAQQTALVGVGCASIQGYLLGHPMPAEAIEDRLQASITGAA